MDITKKISGNVLPSIGSHFSLISGPYHHHLTLKINTANHKWNSKRCMTTVYLIISSRILQKYFCYN